MKTILSLLLLLAAFASAQNSAVTKNATGEVNGNLTISGNNTLTVNGTLTTSTPSVGFNAATPLTWAGVTAQASVQASSGRHGLIVYAPTGTANAIVGWSSSGAVAGKFYQDTSYTAPAVYVGRAATSATIPTFEIGAFTGSNNHTALAINPPTVSTSPFKVTYGGAITGSSLNLSTGGVSAGTLSVSGASTLTGGATFGDATNQAATQIALGGGTAGRAVFGAANAAAARTTLGLASKSITKIVECECFTSTAPGAGEFTSAAINSGTCINSPLANANHPGVISFRDAATTANSGFRMMALTDSIIIGGGELAVSVFNLRSARSTQTVRFGIFDALSNNTPTKGVWLEMVGNGTGVVITGKTVNGGAITSSDTTYTAAVSTWYSARIELTSASSATFTVYNESGTSLWTDTIATAVPTGTTGFGIIAYDSSADGATVMLDLDYLSFEINRTLTR